MSDWTSGYVADIGYTYGYYAELNPLRTRLALLSAGIVLPANATACELGFGQGMSVCMHAAASPTQWSGTDFNPSQAGFAQDLAQVSGSGARLYDEAFDQFCSRADLPEFDFIGLHGIWSWISDENRRVIVDFVRRKLKVGGVLYISYNTLPGWSQMVPMRHLLTQHAETMGATGHGIVKRIDAALDFAVELLGVNPAFARAHPQALQRVQKMKEQNRHYLAHEYFNRDWHPMHFMDMAGWLEPAKLSFGCSAHYMDHIDAVNLTPEQQQFMARIPDPLFREAVRDFMDNSQFRRDYWVKGPRRLSALERTEALRTQRVMLLTPRKSVELKVQSTAGEATLSPGIYDPLLDLMADHKPRTVKQIEQALKEHGLVFGQIWQAIMVLVGKNDMAPVQDEQTIAKVRPRCERLNAFVLDKARGSADLGYLVSPVTGGGIAIGRIQQLFILALQQGLKKPSEWGDFVWHYLALQGQRLMREGRPLESEADNRAELAAQALVFEQERLPLFKALQIVP